MTLDVTFIFFKIYLFIFRQTGREGERKGEKHQYVVASHTPPTGDLGCNPDMCPDWGSNLEPFGSQAGTQSTEPHQPGLDVISNEKNFITPWLKSRSMSIQFLYFDYWILSSMFCCQ